MLNPVIGALLIAATLIAYTVHTILSYKPRHARKDNLPSAQFIRSFAEPLTPTVPKYEMAQEVGQELAQTAQAIMDQIDATLAMAQEWSQTLSEPMHVPARVVGMSSIDWAQEAEDSLTHSRHGVYVMNGHEYDALIAAEVKPEQPAKPAKVRVYHLAQELGVLSADVRLWLEHECGIATKSASSTVTQADADRLREWVATHVSA